MTTNTRRKGRKYELLAARKLELAGWLVHLVKPKRRFEKDEDIFGMFDVQGVRKQLSYIRGEKLYVQVKLNCAWKKKIISELKEFKDKYLNPEDIVQLWDYNNKKKVKNDNGWEIYNI